MKYLKKDFRILFKGDINESGIDYRVVGSFAIAGLLNQKKIDVHLSSERANGTRRDVDIVCISDKEKIAALRRSLDSIRKLNPNCPEVSLIAIRN